MTDSFAGFCNHMDGNGGSSDPISHFAYQHMSILAALVNGAALQFMNGHIAVDGNKETVAGYPVLILRIARAGTLIQVYLNLSLCDRSEGLIQ